MPGVRCALEAARRTLRVASCVSRTEGAHRGGSKSTAAARSALADLSIEDRRLGLRSATVPARMEHAAGIQLARNVPPRRIRRASRPALGLSARHGVCLPMLHIAWRMAHVVCGIAHVALLRRAVLSPGHRRPARIDRASRWAHTYAAAARASRERCTGGGPRRADYGMRRGPQGYGTADPIPGGGAARRSAD
jgi:hypothetical protein